jgi:hypothetical protein|tara:strand:+ start:178 stop:1443 length:1266 start_codon:yes stop_codon:yes gene_type:complete
MIAQVAHKLRAQIHHFSGKLSAGLCKPARRFVEEMIYGIQARGTVRLSDIARSLEETTLLKKTVERLSRNLNRQELKNEVTKAVLHEGSSRVHDDTLLIVDTSDIKKKYARKMEYLTEVRDGSEDVIHPGYSTCHVVGAECGEASVIPLYQTLYSSIAPDFVSENNEILKAIGHVSNATSRRGIFVIDRGGDRGEIYRWIVPEKRRIRFIIRQRGDRHIFYRRQKVETLQLAKRRCKMLYDAVFYKEDKKVEVKYRVQFGYVPVRLLKHPNVQLWMVVVKGFGKQPLMLLTNIPMRRKRKDLLWMIEAYITRWKVEETIRFMKQSYNIEDVRVLKYRRLQNFATLLLAAAFFAAVYLGHRAKLKILVYRVLKAAKRIFGIPDFRYYAIADGIKAILTRHSCGVIFKRGVSPPDHQLSLFAA